MITTCPLIRLVFGPCLFVAMCVALRSTTTQASDSDAGGLFAISHVVDSVEQGGTLTIFGEGLTDDVRVWLWQPSPRAAQVLKNEADLEELRRMAAHFPAAPPLPASPPEGAQVGERLGDTGSHQVTMVRQMGSVHPAWDDSHLLPTVVWLEQAGCYSEPFLVNRPQIWFASEQSAVPGERIRLFGINFYGGHDSPSRPLIALTHDVSREVYWGQPLRRYNQEHANVRQHEISFRLPEELPPGNYEVRIHHLAGGVFGWSNRVSLSVVPQRDWVAQMGRVDENRLGTAGAGRMPAAPPVFRVQDAAGDGITDDGPIIRRSLQEATAAGGGIVVLPAGRFAVTQTVEVPEGVVLQGAGREATSITVSPFVPLAHRSDPVTAATLVHMRTRTGLQDLSVVAGPAVDINVRVEDQTLVEDVFLRRVRIENTHGYLWDQDETNWQNPDFGLLVNSASRGFRLLQSEIVAPMTFRMEGYGRRHRHALIAGNRFETYPHHQQDNVFLLSLSESVFENNVLAYGHRAFTSQRGMWRNYIAHNQTVDIRGVGNGSELFMSEYGAVLYDGAVVPNQTRAPHLQLPADTPAGLLERLSSYQSEHELYAFVAAGTGFGQFRPVTHQQQRTLTLDVPWCVEPDATSTVMLLGASTQNLIVNNSNCGGRGVYTFFYGSAVNNVVVGNEASVGGVTSIWACAVAHDNDSALLAYNMFANNRLTQNGSLNLAALDWTQAQTITPLVIGNRVIRNQVWRPGEHGSPNQYFAFWNWQRGANAGHGWVEPGPRQGIAVWNGSYNVVENNYVDDAEVGLYAGPGRGTGSARSPVRGNLFRWNRVDRARTVLNDQGESTVAERNESASFVEPPEQ